MRVGVHCSVRNGFVAALDEAAGLGCETLQMFTQSPANWLTLAHEEPEYRAFRERRAALKIDPVVVHALYLPNLCTDDDHFYRRSVDSLRLDLERAARLNADFLVIHPGAHSAHSTVAHGFDRLAAALDEVLSAVPTSPRILIENMAGGARRVGGPFRELAEMLVRVHDQDRVGICFDTCHAFAAGYDISTEAGVRATMAEFREEVGLQRLHVFHVNDSGTPRGSHRDIHQHVGDGFIGEAGFRALFGEISLVDHALILETPKQPFPQADRQNLLRLRSLLPGGRSAAA